MRIEIHPRQSLGPVRLGMSREEARSAVLALGLKLEDVNGQIDYFCNAALQVEYDREDKVRFVGISCDPGILAILYGKDVFLLNAKDLFDLVASHEGGPCPEYTEAQVFFPAQGLTLWEVDEQYDHLTNQTRRVWGQVGISVRA